MTPEQAYYHCRKNGKNKELEKIISADPGWAYYYSEAIIRGRWIEAENKISTHSFWACRYALNVIKGKLPENMHNMMLLYANDHAKQYLKFINKPPSV